MPITGKPIKFNYLCPTKKYKDMDASYIDLIKDLLRTGEVDSALKALHQALEKGDGEACAFLGSLYLEGRYVKQDVQRAKAYFQKGAQLGDKNCADNVNLPMIQIGKKGELHATKQNVRDLFRLAKKGFVEPLLMLVSALDKFPKFAKDHWIEIQAIFLKAIDQFPDREELRMLYAYYAQFRVAEQTDLIRIAEVLSPILEKGSTEAACLYLDLAFRNPYHLPDQKKLNTALSRIRKSNPEVYYLLSGYKFLLETDGPGAFAVLSEGAEQQVDLSTIGLAYCYLHGIGTPKDLQKAKQLLLPFKDKRASAPVYLAHIEMFQNPEHPHVMQALNYLDAAEDKDYPYFYWDLCCMMSWCNLRQIPLTDQQRNRWIEIYEEGLFYETETISELPEVEKLPIFKEATYVIKRAPFYKRHTAKTPMGWFQSLKYSWDTHYQLTSHNMERLEECFGLDWDVRCEWAITNAIYQNRWWDKTLSEPKWSIENAKRLSQGRYNDAISQCEQLVAIHLSYKQGDASAQVQKFITYYETHQGEPVAEYTYAWIILHSLQPKQDETTCIDHIKRIKDWSYPYFYQMCADLLSCLPTETAESTRLKKQLLQKGRSYMQKEYTARMLYGCTAMTFLNFCPT